MWSCVILLGQGRAYMYRCPDRENLGGRVLACFTCQRAETWGIIILFNSNKSFLRPFCRNPKSENPDFSASACFDHFISRQHAPSRKLKTAQHRQFGSLITNKLQIPQNSNEKWSKSGHEIGTFSVFRSRIFKIRISPKFSEEAQIRFQKY